VLPFNLSHRSIETIHLQPHTILSGRCWLTVPVALLLASCGGQQRQAPPPPPVDVVRVVAGDVPNIIELPGRIEAVRTAEVRARVDGIVERRLYQEGSDVPAGAPLF
jgi:membrane fusion protein (multidrug efflux system)